MRVIAVMPGSPAGDAGLETGDVITAVDGQTVDSVEAVRDALAGKEPGDKVTFSIRRDGRGEDVIVTLGTRPSPREPVPPIELPVPGMDTPYLGVRLADVTPEVRERLDLPSDGGVAIMEVERGSPAQEAGLRRGDVVLMVGLRRVESVQDVQDAILSLEPGEEVSLLIRRGSQELQVRAVLGAQPALDSLGGLLPDESPIQEGLRSLLPDLGLDLGLLDARALFDRFVEADIAVLDRQGERVELHITPGFLIDVSETEIRLAPNGYSGRDRTFSVTEKTRVFSGLLERGTEGLTPGDRVLVLTRDDSDEALAVFSLRFGGETGLRPFAVPSTPDVLLSFPNVQ